MVVDFYVWFDFSPQALNNIYSREYIVVITTGERNMAKTFDVCKVCSAKKFLNSLGMCKRCAHTSEGVKLMRSTINKQHAAFAEEQKAEAAAEAAKKASAQEEAQESSEGDAAAPAEESKE